MQLQLKGALVALLSIICCGLTGSLTRAEGADQGIYVQPRPAPPTSLSMQRCAKSEDEWRTWRDNAIASLLQPRVALEQEPGPFIDTDQVAAQSFAIANFLDDCASEPDTALESIIGHLARFTRAQRNSLDIYHQFAHGRDVDDPQYLERVKPIAELPCLLRSPEFLRNISDRRTYKDAQSMIEQHNARTVAGCAPDGQDWKTLFYKSRFLGTPDESNTFGRFLVYVPGDRSAATDSYDKWIQFGVWTPDDLITKSPINNVSVVAVPTAQNARGDRFSVALDWWRVYDKSKQIQLSTRKEVTGITGNCQQCHKVAVIGIHPHWAYEFQGTNRVLVRANDQAAVPTDLNTIIERYVSPTFSTGEGDSFADPLSSGPPLAPDLDRYASKPDFMRACTGKYGLDDAAIKRVSAKMQTCSKCHGESRNGRGIINFPLATQRTHATQLTLDPPHWPNLLYAYLKSGLMPLHQTEEEVKITGPKEADALFDCLTLEYHDPATGTGLLVDWLRNESTTTAAAAAPVDAVAKAPTPSTRSSIRPRSPSPSPSLLKQFAAPPQTPLP